MNPTPAPTSWCCHRCQAPGTGQPPWYGLCGQCLADLQTLAVSAQPEANRCPACHGPVCPHCGDAMPILLAVPAPDGHPALDQVTALMIGYQARPEEAEEVGRGEH